jgi:hypothetical protein
MPETAYESHDPIGRIYENMLTGGRDRVERIEPVMSADGPQEIVVFEQGGRIPKDQLALFWREVGERPSLD